MNEYKEHFLKIYDKSSVRYSTFPQHVDIVASWVEKLCDIYPDANREVAIAAAYLHDLGHFIEGDTDHSILSENEAKDFLEKIGKTPEFITGVTHAVRAHRNGDVSPETIEAKIICVADSASHITADVYVKILAGRTKEKVLEKIERDYRDLDLLPQIKTELTPLYLGWKSTITAFPDEFRQFIIH